MNTTPQSSSSISSSTAADQPVQNINVAALTPLITPADLERELPASEQAHRTVVEARRTIRAILNREDPRLLVVLGPCSIHDVDAALDYARRLAELKQRYEDEIYLVMRVYFEKPRTTVGWKGLINDPHLDGTFDMATGIRLARKLLLDINDLGLSAGTEMLDPITPQYIDDLIAWAAIGARTTESQTHRQMASGLSMPVGYKNGTDGNLQIALDAMRSAQTPHHFLGINERGRCCIVSTRGNHDGHVILRGGGGLTNYEPQDVADAAQKLAQVGLDPVLMVDCSHANSFKKHENQVGVWDNLIDQRVAAATENQPCPVVGISLESNIGPGNQKIAADRSQMTYGVSVTDACIDWETTADLLARGHDKLASVRK